MENITLENTLKVLWYGDDFLEYNNEHDTKAANRINNFLEILSEYIKETEKAKASKEYIKNRTVELMLDFIRTVLTEEEQLYVILRKPFVYFNESSMQEADNLERDEKYQELIEEEFGFILSKYRYNYIGSMENLIQDDLYYDRITSQRGRLQIDTEALGYRELVTPNRISISKLAKNLTRDSLESKNNLLTELKSIPSGNKLRLRVSSMDYLENVQTLSKEELDLLKKLSSY